MQRLILLLGLLGTVAPAAADIYIIEKQETKAKSRWSLDEWLSTRDRMRVQDLWLAMHSPSPYEFYLDASYKTGSVVSGGNYQGWDFTAAAYAYIFGIEAQYQVSNLNPRWLLMANFRPFGAYNQATNITFQVGARQEIRSAVENWNLVAGANLTLYLFKAFGGTFGYRHVFPRGTITNPSDRFEAGGFIDFKLLRIHVDYFSDSEASNPGASFHGVQLGARLYL